VPDDCGVKVTVNEALWPGNRTTTPGEWLIVKPVPEIVEVCTASLVVPTLLSVSVSFSLLPTGIVPKFTLEGVLSSWPFANMSFAPVNKLRSKMLRKKRG